MVARFRRSIVRLLLASALAGGVLLVPAGASMAAGPDHPLPPPGFREDATPPGVALTTEIITLPAAQCASMNKALVAAGHAMEPDCRAIHKFYGQNHLPLPAGTITASRGLFTSGSVYASTAYWRWAFRSYECAIYGCWYWEVNLDYDGVANGTHVYQWNVGCTATGYNTTCTWWGYAYNGGGWPNYAMQFGDNSTSCAATSGGPACFGHGQRQWVDDWGNAFNYSAW
jgi:hypothetical protein